LEVDSLHCRADGLADGERRWLSESCISRYSDKDSVVVRTTDFGKG
jgi:hypothetical protein